MLNAVVAGLGIQGVAIVYAMDKLGFNVSGVELSGDTLKSAGETFVKLGIQPEIYTGDAIEGFDNVIVPEEPDIVISALPFNFNYALAYRCINHGIRYCDLGGNIETADRINALADEKGSAPVMTDLGLAPGMVNVVAEIGAVEIGNVESVNIRVGGLPVNPTGTLKYGLLFSIQGLYNEYVENCYSLKDGKKIEIESLTDVEKIDFEGLGELEAFNTSGGIASTLESMQEKGVMNCDYKTLRYPGHVQYIRFLLKDCKMDLEHFTRAISNACEYITEDLAAMHIELISSDGKIWKKQMVVRFDENFTAMQKTTGFGAAAVAGIMGNGLMDGVKSAMYADVPHDKFRENMKVLIPEMVF